jgi:hypothetical protein
MVSKLYVLFFLSVFCFFLHVTLASAQCGPRGCYGPGVNQAIEKLDTSVTKTRKVERTVKTEVTRSAKSEYIESRIQGCLRDWLSSLFNRNGEVERRQPFRNLWSRLRRR